MATLVQTRTPTVAVDDPSIGTGVWLNPTFVLADDGQYASFTAGATTHFLKATGFGFSIPDIGVITGITVSIDRHGTANVNKRDSTLELVKAGVVVGSSKAALTTQWPAADGVATYGGANDLWGTTWTPAEINDPNFGVALSALLQFTVFGNLQVNSFTITVSYMLTLPSAGGPLGCGDYEAYVLTRGGGAIVAQIEWTSLQWGRVLDDTSQATILMDRECVQSVAQARPWRHELGIYRDGVQVWVGPIINPTSPVASDHFQYQLVARDLSAWWDRRFIHFDHDYTLAPVDLATIFSDFAADAMLPDNSPGLTVVTTPTGITGTMRVLATQHLIAGPQLRDLANTGIDWTAIGRSIIAGGKTIPVPALGKFTDDDFMMPPIPGYDGTVQANLWLIRGQGGGAAGDSIYGTASDPAAALLDGLLESVDTVQTIQDNLSAQAAAQSKLALTGDNVVTLQDCTFAASAPVSINDLIPGALGRITLTEGNIAVDDDYRLQRLEVSVSSSDGIEQVVATFQPKGTL